MKPEQQRQGLVAARLERMPVSSWHLRTRLVVGTATFFDAVDTLAIAYVLPVLVDQWHLSVQQVGVVIAAGYAGQLVGAVFFGWLAERIGRLSTLVYTVAVYSVLSIACAFAWNYNTLLAFRIVQGLGLGGEVPVAAAYISEVARARGRGRFFLLYEQVYVAGRVVAALLGVWMVVRFGWRAIFFSGGLSALLVFVLRKSLHESPRWLASRGRFEEADRILCDIENRIVFEGRRLDPPVAHGAPSRYPQEPGRSGWHELLSGIYKGRTVTAWALWFSAYIILNGLGTWVPTLYRTVFHLPAQLSLQYGLVSSIAGFAGCLTVALLVDRTGRRPWFTLGFLGSSLACLVLWGIGAGSATMVLLFTSVTTFFINSNAMLLFLHTSEIYPTRIRALATSVASAWMRLASILGPVLIGLTIENYSLEAIFLQFGIVAAAATVIAGLGSIETRARVLEEISP